MNSPSERGKIGQAIFFYSALIAHIIVGLFVSLLDDYQRKLMAEDLRNFFKKLKENESIEKMFMPILFILYFVPILPFFIYGFLEELFSNDYRKKSLIDELRNFFRLKPLKGRLL